MKSLIQSLWNRIYSYIRAAVLFNKRTDKRRIILIGTPEHGNIGDHLIAVSEHIFFADFFPQYPLTEISGELFRSCRRSLKKRIRPQDLIVITGGGFLGDLWMYEEEMVRDVIRCFFRNTIIIFPQTVYFKESAGSGEYADSKKIYEGHNRLTVCVREKSSFDFLNTYMQGLQDIYLFPDMALYLKAEEKAKAVGKRILLCMRDDCERGRITPEELENYLTGKGYETDICSTVMPYPINESGRYDEIRKLMNRFRSSQIVITDRLHGMLTAYLTGVECIAIDNISHKVAGVFEWIKEAEGVTLASSMEDIAEYLKRNKGENIGQNTDRAHMSSYFEELARVIEKKWKEN